MISFDASAGAAVLFDWNGTVVLDADRAARSLNGVLEARDIVPLDAVAFRREFHLPMADMFGRLGIDDIDAAESDWNAAMTAGTTVARDGSAARRAPVRRRRAGMHRSPRRRRRRPVPRPRSHRSTAPRR